MFSWVSWQKFPLHFLLDYFRRQFETEFFQQDLLVVSGLGNATSSDFRTSARREHDVHRADVRKFCQHSARFAAEPGFVAQLTQSFPEHIRKEAHEDMSQHALFLLMPDRDQ